MDIDNAFDEIGIKEKVVGAEVQKKEFKKLVTINENDINLAVDLKVVPKAYKDARFDIDKIKQNLVEQYKQSKGFYNILRFDDYSSICCSILTSIRSNVMPNKSWLIGAPNGFGKTSFVNECLITMVKNGLQAVPYISLSELAEIKLAEEHRLMKPFSFKVSDNNEYIYAEPKNNIKYIKNPQIITGCYSWSEYLNTPCLFVHFTDVFSKELESHVLYQLLSIRGVKGLPTIALISTSLEPYTKDQYLNEIIWNEILASNESSGGYDRVKHVSCYKRKNMGLNSGDVQSDTGIIKGGA